MSQLLIVEPMELAAIAASRGSGADLLQSRDPKEVWADSAAGSPATLSIDLGSVRSVDTILLGHVRPPAAGAIWSIIGGVTSPFELTIQPDAALRVPDAAGQFATTSHALWTGAPVNVRYLIVTVRQAEGYPSLTAGTLVIGKAIAVELGPEWGSGRQPIDTGTATPLPSGGFAVVDGARKRRYSWTFGDLSYAEAERLEALALALGNTKPGVVIEDAARTAGLRGRIWYGVFEKWKQYERRNRRQTRWEIGIEEWI